MNIILNSIKKNDNRFYRDIIYKIQQFIINDDIIICKYRLIYHKLQQIYIMSKYYRIIYNCVLIELKYYFKYINEHEFANRWRCLINYL